jgi:hypothetical protein
MAHPSDRIPTAIGIFIFIVVVINFIVVVINFAANIPHGIRRSVERRSNLGPKCSHVIFEAFTDPKVSIFTHHEGLVEITKMFCGRMSGDSIPTQFVNTFGFISL